ncbi:hypothetical protein B0H17DRAFT_1334281 [Mycena rosella]|uniref:Uncharacterized protein n=1 Tax=Mycena rosella TaxID=1033263 RepID=A0AAD7G8C5_MYCRO|nr:hypothetical protein B0H17DRAFT_1334281 [Mycena rosella]
MSDDADTNPSPAYLLTRIQRLEGEISALKATVGDPKTNENPAPPPDERCLPLRAWFRGSTSIDAPGQLTWDSDDARLSIQSAGADGNTEELELDVGARDVRAINYTDPDDLRGPGHPVVAIARSGSGPGAEDPQVTVTLQLDARHADWSAARYRALVAWFGVRGIEVFACRPLVAETIWDTAGRVALRRVAGPGVDVPGVLAAVPNNSNGGGGMRRAADPSGVEIPVVLTAGPNVSNGGVVPKPPGENVQNTSASTSAFPGSSHPIIDLTRNVTSPKPNPSNKPGGVTTPLEVRPPETTPTVFLPIKAWYLGHKYFDEAYHLVWANGKITIRSGEAPSPSPRHTEELDVGMFGKTIWYVEPKEEYKDKVLVLDTFELLGFNMAKPIGVLFPACFKQGAARGMGEIVIKFDSGSAAWADSTYKAFVDWVKPKVQERQPLRGKAGDAEWDVAERLAAASDRPKTTIASRKKMRPVPNLPPLRDWSPPPPPWAVPIGAARPRAIRSTKTLRRVPVPASLGDWSPPPAPWATKVSGGPETPIEVESAPRNLNPPAVPALPSINDRSPRPSGSGSKRRIKGQTDQPRKKTKIVE